ncbi:helix-turn-helix domain-containing protein [Pelotomaculum propionicicum]|uniref:helix-turn-helix domain-containing protein n=1 Tax=Pelotomaculum propionicicum TaxID=258475 RepID=UPI003B7DB615
MDESDSFIVSRVPWSSEPSLKEMVGEVGVDVDRFIDGIKNDKTDTEMAEEFDVSEKLIYHLRDHFYTHGVDSVMGQD